MERNYNEKELERKTIPELKEILRKSNLKITSNKDELINRILESESSYMDILP